MITVSEEYEASMEDLTIHTTALFIGLAEDAGIVFSEEEIITIAGAIEIANKHRIIREALSGD